MDTNLGIVQFYRWSFYRSFWVNEIMRDKTDKEIIYQKNHKQIIFDTRG